MNEKIIDFLEGQKVAGICFVDETNEPCCFSCFYVFNSSTNCLYFKSSANARHSNFLNKYPAVAGTIQPNKLNTLAIKGVQFKGVICNANDPLSFEAKALYHKKYPFAMAMQGEVWTVRLLQVKMTDNTLNFGKKLLWELEGAAIR
jgi:uncharacterized protein YhbP (UPF0306 family)